MARRLPPVPVGLVDESFFSIPSQALGVVIWRPWVVEEGSVRRKFGRACNVAVSSAPKVLSAVASSSNGGIRDR
jgi:hypothetical protein